MKLLNCAEDILRDSNEDLVDGAPLLDIKPNIPEFDQNPVDRMGWVEQAKGKVKYKKSDDQFRNATEGRRDQIIKITDYDQTRYHRQMILREWGEAGQRKLKAASVFIAGAGGLGSPAAIYLAVAGVGELRICDLDKIELSNLNRQILHPDARVGEPKALSAEKTLVALNPTINVIAYSETLDESNIDSIVGRPDIILDCLDNYETRYLLNRYSLKHNVPMVHGAVWGMTGQLTFLQPPETPCLRCLVPEPPPQEIFPIVGATPGIIGSIQAMETLKFLTGFGDLLKSRLLLFDGEEMFFTEVEVKREPACPDCGN